MTGREWRLLVCGLAALIAASYLAYIRSSRELVPPQVVEQSVTAAAPTNVPAPSPSVPKETAAPAEALIHVTASAVLATVNGRALKLADLVPLNPAQTNQEQDFSPGTYHYLLDRAVNRELILQTAKAQGVNLEDSQLAQLADFRRQRAQPEPGLVQHLNADSSLVDFEVRDAEAFILQTSLLARTGASPDVTSQDALAYYNLHTGDYPQLPADEPARSQIWADIEYQIRTDLAPSKRAQFQVQLAAYMDQIKSAATIDATPMN